MRGININFDQFIWSDRSNLTKINSWCFRTWAQKAFFRFHSLLFQVLHFLVFPFFYFWLFTPDFFVLFVHFIHSGYHHGLGGGKVIAIHCGWVYEGLNYGPYLTIEEQIALKPTEERRVQYRRTSSFDCYIKKSSEQKSISIHTIQFSVGPKLPPKKSQKG